MALNALILVLTDPPDPLADLVRAAGFTRVLSSGTYLDSLRFRHHLARRLNVAPASVEADVVGEHGTSEVLMWSSARVGTAPVLDLMERSGGDRQELRRAIEHDVRYANIAIIEGNQASQFGIGIVSAALWKQCFETCSEQVGRLEKTVNALKNEVSHLREKIRN